MIKNTKCSLFAIISVMLLKHWYNYLVKPENKAKQNRAHGGNGDIWPSPKKWTSVKRFCDKTSFAFDTMDLDKRYPSLLRHLTFEQNKRIGILPNLTNTSLELML